MRYRPLTAPEMAALRAEMYRDGEWAKQQLKQAREDTNHKQTRLYETSSVDKASTGAGEQAAGQPPISR